MQKQCPRPGCRGQLYQDKEDGPASWTCLQCSRTTRVGFVPEDMPAPKRRGDDQLKEAS